MGDRRHPHRADHAIAATASEWRIGVCLRTPTVPQPYRGLIWYPRHLQPTRPSAPLSAACDTRPRRLISTKGPSDPTFPRS